MDTSGTRIALGTILPILLLLCLPYFSIAIDVIYRPVELLSINCGSSTNFSSLDGRNWTADIKFLSENKDSVAAPALTPSTQQGPYTYARFSHSQFTYSFPVSTGPKFLRLFFYSTSYQNFDRSKSDFSVKAGPYTLLQDFNASLNADAGDEPGDYLFREYCINLEEGQKHLNLSFIPSNRTQHQDSYAFINGIEIVSMPSYLYYTNPDDYTRFPQIVGGATYIIESKSALEKIYRLNVAGKHIPPSGDTGMFRTWEVDDNYVTTQSFSSVYFGRRTLSFTTATENYTAPDEVYQSSRNMGPHGSFNMGFNLSWQLLEVSRDDENI